MSRTVAGAIVAAEAREAGGVGAAEAVDRLVRIADDAEVRAGRRQLRDQPVLLLVDVLEFVDRDEAELCAILRREVRPIGQRAQREADADRRSRSSCARASRARRPSTACAVSTSAGACARFAFEIARSSVSALLLRDAPSPRRASRCVLPRSRGGSRDAARPPRGARAGSRGRASGTCESRRRPRGRRASWASRSRISPAARRVNVTARQCSGATPRSSIR